MPQPERDPREQPNPSPGRQRPEEPEYRPEREKPEDLPAHDIEREGENE